MTRTVVTQIVDERTGEEWVHEHYERAGALHIMTVRNTLTGQVVRWGNASPKFALYDALIKCGCPRHAATRAARHLTAW